MPTVSQYVRTISDPQGLTRSLGTFHAARDGYRRVKVCTGRSAAVFLITAPDGTQRMLKCYLSPPRHGKQICEYTASAGHPALVPVQWLPEELFVYDHTGAGAWYDVAVASWTEGRTLENELRMAALGGDMARLEALAAQFGRLALEILRSEWAHGDLKPENLIVTPSGRMTPVDYDAMFIPPLAGQPTGQTGTPAWQHPAREVSMYDKHIDDYPMALIAVNLYALASDPALYAVRSRGEGILFDAAGAVEGRSELYARLLWEWAEAGDRILPLARMLQSPSPRLEGLEQALATLYES